MVAPMVVESGSTVPRRQLGRLLRQAREQAGIGLEAAAADLEWSRAKMYRIESGQAPIRTPDIDQMCRLYGATAETTEVLLGLARESKSKGWYHAYGEVIPRWFELYVGLEETASRLRTYEPALVPGLLQTPEYTAAVIRSKPGVTEDDVPRIIDLRKKRQQILTRKRPAPPKLEVLMEEGALYKSVPGMAAQIDRLIEASQSPAITVRLIPLDSALIQFAVAGNFVILDFPTKGIRSAEPTTVYSECLSGALYLDRLDEVRAYAEAWNILTANALGEDDSRKLMETIKETRHA